MKKLILLFFFSQFLNISFSQFVHDSSFLKNVEIYFSPFQTRIGGFEYDIIKENENGSFGTSTSINTLKVNDIEFGLNYMLKIKRINAGIGLSYYTDSYTFYFYTALTNKIHKIKKSGVSLNLFYRKNIFQGTTIDIGLNSRLRLRFSSNGHNYSYNRIWSSLNVLTDENWSSSFPIEFIPRIQFNTQIFKNLSLRYGVYAKFWGSELYSVVATEKNNTENIILDFKVNESCLKGIISIGYKFNNR